MSDLPGKPAGSGIRIEQSGDTLRIDIPGRWTIWFWLLLLVALVFTAVAGGLLLAKFGGDRFEVNVLRFLSGWGVLCFCWFFFVFKARDETLIYGRDGLVTRGSFLPLVTKKIPAAQVRDFVLKPVGPEQLMQGSVIFYGYNRRKLLFASGPRDVPLAVQAEDDEFVWLQSVLESHRRFLGS